MQVHWQGDMSSRHFAQTTLSWWRNLNLVHTVVTMTVSSNQQRQYFEIYVYVRLTVPDLYEFGSTAKHLTCDFIQSSLSGLEIFCERLSLVLSHCLERLQVICNETVQGKILVSGDKRSHTAPIGHHDRSQTVTVPYAACIQCDLLKMSIYGSKHVEECNIIWINNNLCIKLVINT
jgi:hypothetical protein